MSSLSPPCLPQGQALKTVSYRYINITVLFMLPESSIIFGAGKNIHTYNAKKIVGKVITNLRGYKKIFFVRTIKGK